MPYKTIAKANGDHVPFQKKKVELSLLRSGAPIQLAKAIANQVENEMTAKSTTNDVYKLAYKLLKDQDAHPIAARYNLKNAIHALGPTGFPFEKFIGRLFTYRGLETDVGVIVQGRCVSHEVDVLAIDEKKERYIECKFHRNPGYTTNVKVPLYIHSRFRDIIHFFEDRGDDMKMIRQSWIVTNTRFSIDAIHYAECSGIKLIGWRYPTNNGLEKLIEDIGMYPITILSFLTDREKQALLHLDKILCIDVLTDVSILAQVHVPKSRRGKVIKEIEALCVGPSML